LTDPLLNRRPAVDSAHNLDGSHLARHLLELLDGVVEDRQAIYISVPITTGKRFLEWRRGLGAQLAPSDEHYSKEHETHVIEPNQANVKPILQSVRNHLRREAREGVVIDPTTLQVSSWTQADYYTFWTTVIARYVSTAVFMNGWEFSSGCTKEFLAAVRAGAELLQEDLRPLNLIEGERLVRNAISALDDEIIPKAPLEEALREIHDASDSESYRGEPH
jgi:hypothetical protein